MGEIVITTTTTLGLIALAEIGDKSQLVCMTLACRYQPLPVLGGAILAFALLNLLAVSVGAVIAVFLPQWLVLSLAAALFALFGIHALLDNNQDDEITVEHRAPWVFLSTLLLIFIAEFGDKTQLAVAALAGAADALPVWLGATLALTLTSSLGVLAGRTLLKRLPLALLRCLSGGLFLLFALAAALRAAGF